MAKEDVPAVGVREAGAGVGDDPALPALPHRRDQQRDRCGRTTLRLSAPPAERGWGRAVLEKILSVYLLF